MGIGIVSRYRYSFEGTGVANTLKNDIQRQIEKYLPELQGVDVQVTEQENSYVIKIIIDEVLYDFTFNTSSGTLDYLAKL